MSDAKHLLPPLDGRTNPCLCCPPIPSQLPLDALIAVGFGAAILSKDGEPIYIEGQGGVHDLASAFTRYHDMTVEQAEIIALSDESADWRITLHGPFHGETYQRHGKEKWLLVEKVDGFA